MLFCFTLIIIQEQNKKWLKVIKFKKKDVAKFYCQEKANHIVISYIGNFGQLPYSLGLSPKINHITYDNMHKPIYINICVLGGHIMHVVKGLINILFVRNSVSICL